MPLPRPVMEEVIPGAVEAGIKLDIPFPEMATVDLTFPKIGLNWIRQPMDWIVAHNPFSFSFYEDKLEGYNLVIGNRESEITLFLGTLLSIGLATALLEKGFKKIWN